MKYKRFIFYFLIGSLFFLSHDNVFAQQIQNTGVTLKNYNNTSVLYSGGINENQYAIAYNTGKVEFPFGTSVAYDNSYSFTMTYDFTIPYTTTHSQFGWGNPELYINSNGLQQQVLTISSFSNTLVSCEAVTCRYRLNLAFTFGSNAAGTLYLAIPVSPAHPIYGWNYINIDLTSYGANTSNSDIINNNNQNTQNIINNQNQNTQQIINSNNQINNSITDDTPVSDSELTDFFDSLPVISFGPVSSLLQIPITIFNDILTNLLSSRNCSDITLGNLYGSPINLTCVDIKSKLGDRIYNFIDYVFAIYIIYSTFMLIINNWDSWTSLDDQFNSLYVGKHTKEGYTPRHGGGN